LRTRLENPGRRCAVILPLVPASIAGGSSPDATAAEFAFWVDPCPLQPRTRCEGDLIAWRAWNSPVIRASGRKLPDDSGYDCPLDAHDKRREREVSSKIAGLEQPFE